MARGQEDLKTSPGHKDHPEHKVVESRPKAEYILTYNGRAVAHSADVIKVEEDDHIDRFYFPLESIERGLISASKKRTFCPFKGEAGHFTLSLGEDVPDVAWTYLEPFKEHADLRDRVAFYHEKKGFELKENFLGFFERPFGPQS